MTNHTGSTDGGGPTDETGPVVEAGSTGLAGPAGQAGPAIETGPTGQSGSAALAGPAGQALSAGQAGPAVEAGSTGQTGSTALADQARPAIQASPAVEAGSTAQPGPTDQPDPRDETGPTDPSGPAALPVHLPAGLPAWTLRLVSALTCTAVGLLLAANGVQGVSLVLFALVSAAAVTVPASAAPALVIGFAAATLVFTDGGPFRPSVLALVVLLHLFHTTCAITALVPPRSRLHLGALRRPARRFALTQVLTFTLVGVTAVLPSGGTEPVVEVVGLLTAAALAAAAVVLTRPKT
ncbi:hypothetical protein ACFFQW_18725 [Umezawaea endophytica]|uniref:Uncharacterized protein n=1 Tax=Umezawaea endophytica TaxID=1654476 RepID=A0A9X3AGA8_9PSEU|nr:hypothetical protein [Umezawaea endophytica]MCS7479897.1 hypothetical protein [Umezawaea endophytica]